MKTYSVALQNADDIWFTNWHKYFKLSEIKWDEVKKFAKEGNYKAYGYYYGHKSNELTSSRCRTIIETL